MLLPPLHPDAWRCRRQNIQYARGGGHTARRWRLGCCIPRPSPPGYARAEMGSGIVLAVKLGKNVAMRVFDSGVRASPPQGFTYSATTCGGSADCRARGWIVGFMYHDLKVEGGLEQGQWAGKEDPMLRCARTLCMPVGHRRPGTTGQSRKVLVP